MSELLVIAVAHQRDAVLITEAERVDPAGRRIVFVNPAFTMMTGWSADEAIGKTPDLLVGDFTDRATIRRIVAAIDAQRPVREEILKYRKDGTTLWVEMDVAPVRDPEGQCRHFISVMRDVSEQKLQRDLLAAQAAELERVGRQRSQLLASLSHELRTPLNAIVGLGSLLLEGAYEPLAPGQAKAVTRIQGNVKTLVALIDELLDVSRIEAGRLSLSRERFNVLELVNEVMAELQPMAGELAVSADGPTELVACGDRQKTKQIVTNLVSNALKYTPRGTVHVTVARDGRDFTVAVTDSGVGIAKADHERVFEEYWQASTARSRGRDGVGLGLYIARRLASLMGGALGLASEVGRGSTFTLRLPRELPADREEPAADTG